jgi:DNA segregation ATPase FtsK/SpoIIIE, S-DNA-T family
VSAEHVTPMEGTVIPAADRFAKGTEVAPAADAVQLGAVEKVSDATPRRTAGEVAAESGTTMWLGLAHSVQTAWDYQNAGEIGEQIRSAKVQMRATTDRDERARLAEEIERLRARRREVVHARHREPATIASAIGAVAYPAGVIIGTLAAGPLALAGVLPIPLALYVAGRRARRERELVTLASAEHVELAAGASEESGDRAALEEQPALDGGVLADAIKACGFSGQVKILEAPAWGDDGTSVTRFELPPGVTVSMLKKKEEQLAGALGRDVAMIDLTKEGSANRGSLWMTDRDPFEDPRPSPLLNLRGGIDAWGGGVPVAWSKRGVAISLGIRNSSFVIAGMTRSGKGVGAANLAAGSALDVRINLRIVAGKSNGEWDPYANTGVAATYFKPNSARLLALLQALLADMDRRNRVLGELGKSKMTPETIEKLGGIELLIIDEVATYTRENSCPERDDILAALLKLSAVAAGAGILLVLITQYPEAGIIPQGLAMNCGTRWAMRVDNATQSNAILGGGASSSGRDASKFDPPRPGLGWLVNPFLGVTDKARSFDLDEDERGEVTQICERAADLRRAVGRLTSQWDDPIERHLLNATGLSSAAGGPRHDGQPGRALATLTAEQRQQVDALRGALAAMDRLGRDAAQKDEMAALIGDSVTGKPLTGDRLGDLLRAAGAGGTTKVTIPGLPNRVNGYNRADLEDALRFFEGS